MKADIQLDTATSTQRTSLTQALAQSRPVLRQPHLRCSTQIILRTITQDYPASLALLHYPRRSYHHQMPITAFLQCMYPFLVRPEESCAGLINVLTCAR